MLEVDLVQSSYNGCFFFVSHSRYRILLLSSSDTSATISFYLYQIHFTSTASLSFAKFFLYLYTSRQQLYQIFFSCFPETNPYSWFSCILVPLYLYPLHSTKVTFFYFIIYPCSSRAVLLRDILYISQSQYSCTFLYKKYTGLLSCYIFCGLTIYIASLLLLLSFFFLILIFGHSHLQYPIFQHLKHCTSTSAISCLLTCTSSFTSHCITLLAIILNLFWRISFSFISSFLFLQFWTRYLNLLHFQYTLSLLSIFALSLARVHYWLSILLIRELY